MFIAITVIGVISLVVIFSIGIEAEDSEQERMANKNILTFEIPNEIIANHRPTMKLIERERRRRRLLNETFSLGLMAREELERKQAEDKRLSSIPYNF